MFVCCLIFLLVYLLLYFVVVVVVDVVVVVVVLGGGGGGDGGGGSVGVGGVGGCGFYTPPIVPYCPEHQTVSALFVVLFVCLLFSLVFCGVVVVILCSPLKISLRCSNIYFHKLIT